MTVWYSEPLAAYAEEKILTRNENSEYEAKEVISSIKLTSEYGEKTKVVFNLNDDIFPTRSYPSIEKGEYKLVWVISSDANWDGLDAVKILTLDLVTMQFSESLLGNLIDQDTIADSKFDGGTNFDLELRNDGKSLLFTIKDIYKTEQATYLFHWKDTNWTN